MFTKPPRMLSKARDTSKYCEFRQDYCHDTNTYRELKNQIEKAVKSGKLAHLIKGIRKGKAKQTDNQLGEWTTPAMKTEPVVDGNEEPILMIGNRYRKIGNETFHNAFCGPVLVKSRAKGHHVRIPRHKKMRVPIQECIKFPTFLQNIKRMTREERFHMDKGIRQRIRRNKEIHKETPHPRSTKSGRELDSIFSSLKRMRKCSPDGRKRKRSKARILRRIARWAIKLGEHKIEFKPRNAIKAQVLAYFLAENQEEDDEIDFQSQEEKGKNTGWKLYTDGASSDDGPGAGLMIISPEGMEFTYALKFEFTATNNAKEMKIEEITVFVDSQLVANQVNGSYEAKHHDIKQYLQIANELLKSFRRFEV
ncbi:reverse transcriptase domain-containing protein [Tanacetum coccineum]